MNALKHIHFPPPVADDMVCAILADRKTATRRACKIVINDEDVLHRMCHSVEYPARNKNGDCAHFLDKQGHFAGSANQPYRPGDILYVRETWAYGSMDGKPEQYFYKADYNEQYPVSWHPSIHMPRKAARIFLLVTGVRVERLQDMPPYDIAFEGFRKQKDFIALWDSTIKPADRVLYGWDANPWVWVIEFERIGREKINK